MVKGKYMALIYKMDCKGSHLNMMLSRSKGYSMIPVVGTLTRKISCNVGR